MFGMIPNWPKKTKKPITGHDMIQQLRIRLARWILGAHCPCYRMGYHNMVDFDQRSADAVNKYEARKKNDH